MYPKSKKKIKYKTIYSNTWNKC